MKTTLLKKVSATILSATVIASTLAVSAFAAQQNEVDKELFDTSKYLLEQNNSADYFNDYALGAVISGAADESFKDSYKKSIEDALKENDGKLMYTDQYSGDTAESLMYESSAVIALHKMGFDVSDIGGYDLTKAIESFDLTLIDNPYHLCEALKASKLIGAGEENISRLIDALMTYYTDNGETGGMDYWGISTDNNGAFIEALAPFSDSDEKIKSAIEKSVKFIEKMKRPDGYDSSEAYASENGNADSTALALRAFIAVNDGEKAQEAYNYLLGFKSQEKDGAYLYAGDESVYAAKDAQYALLAYSEYLLKTNDNQTESETTEAQTGAADITNAVEATDSVSADNTENTENSSDNNGEDTTANSESSLTTQTSDANPNTGTTAQGIAVSAAAFIVLGIIISNKRR